MIDDLSSMDAIARRDGLEAFERGARSGANPYVRGSVAWRAWYRGYVLAGLDPVRVARRVARERELEARARWRRRSLLLVLAAFAAATYLAAWLEGWRP